jgi:hypothetical protein
MRGADVQPGILVLLVRGHRERKTTLPLPFAE